MRLIWSLLLGLTPVKSGIFISSAPSSTLLPQCLTPGSGHFSLTVSFVYVWDSLSREVPTQQLHGGDGDLACLGHLWGGSCLSNKRAPSPGPSLEYSCVHLNTDISVWSSATSSVNFHLATSYGAACLVWSGFINFSSIIAVCVSVCMSLLLTCYGHF